MDFQKLGQWLEKRGEKSYRRKQIIKAFGSGEYTSYDELTDLPLSLREALSREIPWFEFSVDHSTQSADGTRKIVVRLNDGARVEAVLMHYKNGRYTVCCSSQVGCAMNCSFCATGKMGFKRNLTSAEITDQIAWFHQVLKKEGITEGVNNIVFMGMGEPFHNYDSVAQALRDLQSPEIFGFGWRRLSVSTSGLVPEIKKFAIDFPQVNLAVSLHAPTDELRSKIMPINRGFPLAMLREACCEYVAHTNRKVFFEYLLLKGVNDGPVNARLLAEWLSASPLFHLNLIKYHSIDHAINKHSSPEKGIHGTIFKEPCFDEVWEFGGLVKASGQKLVTIRRTLGEDIQAACGQLVVATSQ